VLQLKKIPFAALKQKFKNFCALQKQSNKTLLKTNLNKCYILGKKGHTICYYVQTTTLLDFK